MQEAAKCHHDHAEFFALCVTLLATSQPSVLSENQVICGEITFAVSFSHCGGLIQIDSNMPVTGGPVCKSIKEKMLSPPSQMEQMIPTLLICCISPVREPPEWRSAGCYFHSITPCRLCCSRSSWNQHRLREVTDRIRLLHISLWGTSDLPLMKPPNRLHP